jgi:YD repeat-containing protein
MLYRLALCLFIVMMIHLTASAQTGTDHIPTPDEQMLVWDEHPLLPNVSRYGKPDCSAGLGVDAKSGNLYLEELEFSWYMFNHEFAFKRYYNSLSSFTTTVGKGWRHSFLSNVFRVSDRYLLLIQDDGREIPFVRTGRNGFAVSDNKLDTLFFRSDRGYFLKMFNSDEFEFDRKGKLKKAVLKGRFTFFMFYDMQGRLISVLDQIGRELQFLYAGGMLTGVLTFTNTVTSLSYNDNDQLTKVITNQEMIRQYGYNKAGRLSEFKDLNTSVFKIDYGLNGKVKRIIEPSGNIESYRYPSLLGLYSFNKMKSSRNGRVNSYRMTTKRVRVNEAGKSRKEQMNRFGQTLKVIQNGELTERKKYGSNHLVSEVINSKGVVNYNYTPNGQLSISHLENGNQLKYRYNDKQQLIGLIDENAMKVTRYERNHLGLISSLNDGHETICYYDTLGNLIRLKYKNDTEKFVWDESGNLVVYSDSMGNRVSAEFNRFNQLVELKLSVDWKLKLEYDRSGNLTRIVYPSGSFVLYTYDILNWLSSETIEGRTNYFFYNDRGEIILPDEPGGKTTVGFGSTSTPDPDSFALGNQELFQVAHQLKAGKVKIALYYKNPHRKGIHTPTTDYIFYIDLSGD